jgi:nucleosome binding factor SPN SPT16 subunit
MVGTRRNLLSKNSSYTKGQIGPNGDNSDIRQDIESGYGTINSSKPQHRFRDAIKQTMYSNRAQEMKKKLIDNVDHEALEIYRKSDQSVSIPALLQYQVCH